MMASSKDGLDERLARYRQIRITVTGRKSGRVIALPVWFVLDGKDTLYLLPLRGTETEWYKNLVHNPKVQIAAREQEAEFRATAVTDTKTVKAVVEKFREKYGAEDVKHYYSKFDAVVQVNISP